MPDSTPRFGTLARRAQADFRSTLSFEAQHPNDDKGIRNGHLIASGHEMENLFPSVRGPDGALAFFSERKIKWWRNGRSGDGSLKDGFDGPTRNLASSQIACINFLLPLSQIPGALLRFLRCIDDDVEEVVTIVDQEGRSSLVEFEWVGWAEPLEGGPITRGAYKTSIDALIVARIDGEHRVYLFEWKYLEEYLNPDDKGVGSSGQTRRARYQGRYERSSSFNQVATLEDFFFEPFYQIMRIILLGDKIRAEGVTPDLQIDAAKVIVVCPGANLDYRRVVRSVPLAARFTRLDSVEDVVRATLNDQDSFSVIAPEDIISDLRQDEASDSMKEWLDYHSLRYGW